MRGKAYLCHGCTTALGITPACAGKSLFPRLHRCRCWDHPRVCGEKCRAWRKWWAFRGSPPRVRGKVYPSDTFIVVLGITPACAGKSHFLGIWFLFWRDHPRVCGEKVSIWVLLPVYLGSPPRVRGKVEIICSVQGSCRITPACAGKR